MEIINIAENIFQFTFINERSEFPLNIIVLQDGETAILIDVAYKKYADQVKEYLAIKGVSKFVIFISHHHEDHFDGCKSFPNSFTYASNLFSEDYQEHLQSDEYLKSFKPDEYLIDGNDYRSEKFIIKFIYTPGHNICEYSFLINEKYLYVGDLIFYNKTGLPSLPYLDANSKIREFIESLEKIGKIQHKYMLLGHGHYLDDKAEIKKQIDERLHYLNKIKSTNGDILLEDCLKNDKSEYSGLSFHKTNIFKK